MADEDTLAVTPGETTAAPANDGFIDLDAVDAAAGDEGQDEDEQKAKAEEPKPEGDEDKPKKPSGAQRAKIREQRLLDEISARDRELEDLRRSAPAAKASDTEEDKEPREADYNGDFFAYQTALTAWKAGKAASDAIEKRLSAREETERTNKQAELVRERAIAHAERVEDAREVIADFDQVMGTMKGVNVRNEVIEEIMSSEKSALLAYHLAQNPEKLSAMNSMSARELAREMGRLEATVALPSAKKATTAPAPPSTLKGGAAPSSAESDLNAWLARTYPKR
jgi:hypothetical protein